MHAWPGPTLPQLPGHAGDLRLHDTSTQTLRPVTGEPVGLYVCGITPYDATHLGHAATYVTFDLVGRVVRDAGHEVDYVQNVTDVDDPLFERAARDGIGWRELGDRETELFREDMTALRVVPPRAYVAVTESMEEIRAAVRELLGSGRAYLVPVPDGTAVADDAHDVYLAVTEVEEFGDVSGWSREEMLAVFAERGGDPDRAGKRDALDPLLWRAAREGEPAWEDDVLGAGRPGWHIECTAIARERLGVPFTVQGGGSDLVFPHHEMSAAQSAAAGEPVFAHLYSHQAMVGYDGEKMSKSRGNLVLVSRLRAAGADPMAVRLVLLDHHYRTDWTYEDSELDRATVRLGRWRVAAGAVAAAAPDAGEDGGEVLAALRDRLTDDLDAPGALRALDAWADRVAAGDVRPGDAVVRDAVDALLGIAL